MCFRLMSSIAAVLVTLVAGTVRADEPVTLTIGVTAGPHAQIFEVVKPIAAKAGLIVKIVEFSDYNIPNAALAAGDLQANSFQHRPYLDNQIKDRGYDLVSAAPTVVFPMGIYSRQVKQLSDLPTEAIVAIPNDPTNGGRALLLLQAQGLLTLRDGVGIRGTVLDLVANPKSLKLKELDAAQLPRSLDDVAAAAINTNYALEAGLNPLTDAVARESPDSPYTNVIAVRRADAGQPWVATLVAAYHAPEVRQFILDHFKGAVVPGW